jgi:hypothetical protein
MLIAQGLGWMLMSKRPIWTGRLRQRDDRQPISAPRWGARR